MIDHDNELDRLQQELREARAQLQAFQTQGTTIRVSAKGGVSVYGLGRYPTTLYKSQWRKLLAMRETILAFIAAHENQLPEKAK